MRTFAVRCATSAVFGKLGRKSELGESGSTAPAPEFSLSRQLAATHSSQPFYSMLIHTYYFHFCYIMGKTLHTYLSNLIVTFYHFSWIQALL